MSGVWFNRTNFNEVFDFGDRNAGSCGHNGIKVSRCLAINEIAPTITFPRFDKRKIGLQSAFEHEHPPVIFASLFAFCDDSTITRWCEKCRDPRSARADTFREGSLRHQLHFELAGQGEFLKQLVLSNIRRDHFSNLSCCEQHADAKAVNSCIVTYDSEVLDSFFACCVEEIFGNSTDTKATRHDRCSVIQIRNGFAGIPHNLIHAEPPRLNKVSISSKFPPSIESRIR